MVVIVNVKSLVDVINIYLDGGMIFVEWGMWNVCQKQVQNMVMKYKMGIFFVFCFVVLVGNIVYMELVEIFMGVVLNVVIFLDVIVILFLIVLKCEVFLMCVCLNVKDKEGNMNNENIVKGVDFI